MAPGTRRFVDVFIVVVLLRDFIAFSTSTSEGATSVSVICLVCNGKRKHLNLLLAIPHNSKVVENLPEKHKSREPFGGHFPAHFVKHVVFLCLHGVPYGL